MKRLFFSHALAVLILGVVLALNVTPAFAMTDAKVTLNKDTGAQPARFTFKATTDATDKTESLSLTFPKGFDISKSYSRVVTLQGLKRTTVKVTEERQGETFRLTFDPPIEPKSTINVFIYEVRLPETGGSFALKGSYGVAGDGERPVSGDLTFDFATVTKPEQMAAWLDQQPWVQTWNSVGFLNLFFKPQQIVIAVPVIFGGWLVSLALVGVAFPLAIVGGLGLAFLKMAKLPVIRWPASAYVNIIRGTPLFLQIFVFFVGLPIAGIHLPWFMTGVIVLALNSSAYLAEIFRAGIQSIHKGQFEASSSLGMTYAQSMRYVIIPQTVKRVLPTTTSEFILLFKDTALLMAVGVFEAMLLGNGVVARTGNLTAFVVLAVYYLIVTTPLINWVASLERKLAISEGGQAAEETKPSFIARMFGRRPVTPPVLAPEDGELASASSTERR